MNGKFLPVNFFALLIFAISAGVSIKLLSFMWKRFFNIDTGPWDVALLGGSCVGLFIFLNAIGLPRWAWGAAAFVIVGRFLGTFLERNF